MTLCRKFVLVLCAILIIAAIAFVALQLQAPPPLEI